MISIRKGPVTNVCENPDSPWMYFGWPSVTRLPDGTLAMAASGFRLEHVCPFGKAVISYSRDEGCTWTKPAPVIDTPLDDRDAGIVPFGNGRAILTSFNNTTAFQRGRNAAHLASDDPKEQAKGRFVEAYLDYVDALGTQEEYLGSTYVLSEDGGYTFGKVHRVPVTAPHGPCRMNDGSLLYVGRRFDGADKFDAGDEPYVQVWHMDADGDTFAYRASIENVGDEHGILNSCEPHAIQLADGRIVVHIRVQRTGENSVFTVYQSVSEDGGYTFTQPVPLLTEHGGSPAHLLSLSDGTLLSVYGYREAPYGIRAMFSKDGGRTWDTDNVLYDGGQSGDLGYPATVQLRGGSLLTLWYENTDGVSRVRQTIWSYSDK